MQAIENMLAGRELDALVSEQVMGISVVCYDWPCGCEPECGRYEAAIFVSEKDGKYTSNCGWHDERGPVIIAYPDLDHCWPPYRDAEVCEELIAHVKPVPRYSTDIAAAWQAVEKTITGTTWECYLTHQFDGWSCLFAAPDRRLDAHGVGASAPLAICRAVLRAVEVLNDNSA